MKRIVIVGGGQAAGQAAATLRQEGFEEDVLLVSEEDRVPYQRPPLSKQYLAGEQGWDRVQIRPEDFYEDREIALELGTRVESVAPREHRIVLEDGQRLAYDKLILATGSRVRRLDLPGSDLDGVCYLRTLEDSDAIKERLAAGRRLIVVGGGYIGLEVASVAATAGLEVTVLEAADRILQRVATPPLSDFYAYAHRERGVAIHTGVRIDALRGDGQIREVALADGRVLPADVVVVGIGIVPEVDLAARAGIACDDGILVDGACRTSAPDVLAAGDCTRHPTPFLDRPVRLESVPNAMEQGRIAGAVALGKERTHSAEPWFWSDQYDLKLQMVGFAEEADTRVIRGSPADGQFMIFHLKQGVVVAVDAVNSVREFLGCRKLVAERRAPDPEKLADASIPIKELLAASGERSA